MTATHSRRPRLRLCAAVVAIALGLALTSCGSDGTKSAAKPDKTPTNGSSQVLPVTDNPIANTATEETLSIDSVLVENNEDDSGKAADDHLEIALSNTGTTDLSGFEVFYTITDPTAGTSESYYTKLPTDFSIGAGASRVAHFDNTGAPDHFPDNEFSLYHTSSNELDVTVEVSASGAAVQTAKVKKDAGGDEIAD